MKILCLFLVISTIIFMSACTKENTYTTNTERTIEIENMYISNSKLKIDAIIAKGEGFVDITSEDFIKKANTVTLETTEVELIEIFGQPFGFSEETSINNCYYFNETYFLNILPGVSVTVCEINNPEKIRVIASIEPGQSGDGSMIEP